MHLRLLRRTRPTGSEVSVNFLLLWYSSSGVPVIRRCVACFMTPCSGSSIFTGRTASTAVKLAEAISNNHGSALAHDVFWFLVLTQAEESGVSQFASLRPLGKCDLGNEPWLHPMDAAARQPISVERA